MTSDSVSRRSALRTGAGAVAAGVTIVALPAAAASASEGGSSGSGYGGYTAQQIANFVTVNFSNTGGNRSLGFNWQATSPTANVGYTSSVSGAITTSPWNATATGGTVPTTSVSGWDPGELLDVTLSASGSPFTANVSFQVDSNGRTRNWTVDGVPVDNPDPLRPFAGYTAQEVANMVGFQFSSFGGLRSLGFTWRTPVPAAENVDYSSSVAGSFTTPAPPWTASSSAGVVLEEDLVGWSAGETLNITLVSTEPFAATVTFDIASNGGTSNWKVNGGDVTNPNDL